MRRLMVIGFLALTIVAAPVALAQEATPIQGSYHLFSPTERIATRALLNSPVGDRALGDDEVEQPDAPIRNAR